MIKAAASKGLSQLVQTHVRAKTSVQQSKDFLSVNEVFRKWRLLVDESERTLRWRLILASFFRAINCYNIPFSNLRTYRTFAHKFM